MKIHILLSAVILTLLFTATGLKSDAQQPGGTSGQAAEFTLKQAQDFALQNSAAIRNADIDLQLAKKKIWETTAIGLPQVSGQLNYQHIFGKIEKVSFGMIPYLTDSLSEGTPITSDDIENKDVYLGFDPMEPITLVPRDNATLDITVSQLIFSGEYLVGLRAAKVFYLVSDQSKQKVELDTKESVANTYTLVLMLQSTYDVMAQSLNNINKTLNEMREMNKQGFIELTDVDQIELTTLTLQNGVNSMERQITAAKDLLKFQIGYPMDKEIILTDNLEVMASDVNLESLVSNGFKLENNINYQLMDTQVRLNKLSLQREKTTYLPSISAAYRHQEKFVEIGFDFQPVDVLVLSMNIPIFSSGQRLVKVQQRRLEYDKSVINRDNAGQGLQLEYINARNEMINSFDNFTNVKRNLELTKRIYDKTLIKFREGLSTSMDLTQAQNQFLSAQSEYIKNLNALLSAKNKLTKLTTN